MHYLIRIIFLLTTLYGDTANKEDIEFDIKNFHTHTGTNETEALTWVFISNSVFIHLS